VIRRDPTPVFGAAVSADSLTFVRIDEPSRGRRSGPGDEGPRDRVPDTFVVALADEEFPAAVGRALNEAAAAFAVTTAQVSVALLPPLVDVRVLSVPERAARSIDAYLRQEAARLFFAVREPVTVGVIAQAADGGARKVLAAALPTRILEAVHAGARAAGFDVISIVAAHGAWLRAAEHLLKDDRDRRSNATRVPWLSRLAPAPALMNADIEVRLTEHVLAMSIRDGVALPVRRRLHGDRGSHAFKATVPLSRCGVRVVIGAQASSDQFGRKSTVEVQVAKGGEVLEAAASDELAVVVRTDSRSPSEVAARFARGAPLELLLDEARAWRDRASRRRVVRSVTAALAIATLAAAVHLLGLRRQLGEYERQRAAIAGQVAPFRAQRDSLARLAERLAVLKSTRSGGTGWTDLLFDLALRLPSDAWIHAVSTAGDTITVRASATRAGDAMQALSSSTVLGDLRIDGAIERELLNDTAAIEHFMMVGRIASPSRQ